MNNIINKEEEKGKEKSKIENQEQYRVVINKSASEMLEKMLVQVTNGFEGGSISKSDLANWIILNSQESFGEAEIKTIRQLHFDERKILASILKDSKDENRLPENLKRAIREHFGLAEAGKKRASKEKDFVV
jgi:hypothetical protein